MTYTSFFSFFPFYTAGWTPLHYAALLAPPTLVSHLLTHGSSPLCRTRRGLTALDIVSAHSIVPGREDVALLLEEAMREHGWTGGRMEEHRRSLEQRARRMGKRKSMQDDIVKILGISSKWWGDPELETSFEVVEDEEDDDSIQDISYVSHLVWADLNRPGRQFDACCRRLLQDLHICLFFLKKHYQIFFKLSLLTISLRYEMLNRPRHCTCLLALLVYMVTRIGWRT